MDDGLAAPRAQGIWVRELPRDGCRELFVTCPAGHYQALGKAAGRAAGDGGPRPLRVERFGPVTDLRPLDGTLAEAPTTTVLGGSYPAGEWGGVHAQYLLGAEPQPIVVEGRTVGMALTGPYATECWLSGIRPTDPSLPADRQAREAFERMEQALQLVGMDFGHVVRTWLFLDDILAWYADFNRVRTAFFRERGVFDRMVPASTGIGGGNPDGTALVAGVYALKSSDPRVRVEPVPSPLQCPALQYDSSFSRAAEVALPDIRRLLVSGTASISPDGETQHVGDVAAQVARTCEVVEAILVSRGMTWEDVTRATAYVRDIRDAPAFGRYWAATGRPLLPVVIAENVICRDELLFELEVDAVRGEG
jgi:enamine deaminase RidA (YjgF/YER057c/UK114 family)